MEKIIGLMLFMLVSFTAIGGGVNHWWEHDYEGVQQKQQQKYQRNTATRCKKEIQYYKSRLKLKHGSSYYRYKLNSWISRCREDSTNNPYIK